MIISQHAGLDFVTYVENKHLYMTPPQSIVSLQDQIIRQSGLQPSPLPGDTLHVENLEPPAPAYQPPPRGTEDTERLEPESGTDKEGIDTSFPTKDPYVDIYRRQCAEIIYFIRVTIGESQRNLDNASQLLTSVSGDLVELRGVLARLQSHIRREGY